MAKTKRLEIRAEESFVKKLEELAKASGTSKADIIGRAVGLYARAWEEAEHGRSISFVVAEEAEAKTQELLPA